MTIVSAVAWWVLGVVCGVFVLARVAPRYVLRVRDELQSLEAWRDQLKADVDDLGEHIERQRRIFDEDTRELLKLYESWPEPAPPGLDTHMPEDLS